MPATTTETVGLDLKGDFKSKAQEDAAAALQAAEALEKLGLAATGIKGPPKSAVGAVDELADHMKAAKEAAERYRAEADKAFAVGNKRRGEALERTAEKLDPIFKENKEGAKFWERTLDAGVAKAKDWIAGGAAAAAAIAAAGAYLLKTGVEFGIRQSAEREKQTRIFDKLTKGSGELAYAVTLKLAGETGLDPKDAAERVKGLIQAQFDQADTELLFKAAADLGEVKGADKGKAFLEQLQKTGAKGAVNDESLNSLVEAGVATASVLEKLRQKGESLDSVRARVKNGQIAVKEFAQAVGKAVEGDIGGIAGKGLDAQINRLKIGFNEMFTGWDLGPLEKAGTVVEGIMKGADGEALKKGIGEAGQAAIDLFKVFQTPEGKQAVKDVIGGITEGAKVAVGVLRELKDGISDILKVNAEHGKGYAALVAVGKLGNKIIGEGESLHAPGINVAGPGFVTFEQHRAEVAAKAAEEAKRAGGDIAKGYAEGISRGAPLVADAVNGMLQGGIEGGNKTLERRSPSKVFAGMGKDSALGYAKGANDNAGVASDATASMARRAAGAAGAAGGAGVAAGGAASGGAPSLMINLGGITIQGGPSGASAASAQAAAVMAELEPLLAAAARRIQRDLSEFGGGLTTRVA